MTDFLLFLLDTAKDFPLGTLMFLLLIISFVAVTGMIMCGVFVVIDSWGVQVEFGRGRIVGRHIEPAHNTLILVGSVPVSAHYEAEWSVCIDTGDGKSGWITVSEEFYNKLYKGTTVHTVYATGRLSGNPYIKSFHR